MAVGLVAPISTIWPAITPAPNVNTATITTTSPLVSTVTIRYATMAVNVNKSFSSEKMGVSASPSAESPRTKKKYYLKSK